MIASSIAKSIARPIASSLTEATVASGAAAFDPASLFANSEQGGIYDFSAIANLSTDSGGTTAVSAIGDQIGRVEDGSGNDNDLTLHLGNVTFGGFPASIGDQIVESPEFETPGDWTAGTGWSVSSGTATKTAGTASSLEQSITLTAGDSYLVSFCIQTRTAGTISLKFSGTTDVEAETTYSTAGEYFDVMTAATGNNTIEISADASFAGTITILAVYPVSDYAIKGARFIGNGRLRTESTVDMSTSNAMAVFVAGKNAFVDGFSYIAQAGPSGVSGTRTAIGLIGANRRIITSDGTVTTNINGARLTEQETGFVVHSVLDTDAAAIEDQATLHDAGFELSLSHSVGNMSATAMDDEMRFSFGSWLNNNSYFNGIQTRGLVINRTLTDQEETDLFGWLTSGQARIGIVGDSVWDEANSSQGLGIIFSYRTGSCIGGVIGLADVATWGDQSSQQLTAWQAVSSTYKDALDAVIVAVGHNDVKGRLDTLISGGNTYAQAYASISSDFQALIDDVTANTPDSCKIIGVQLIPCKAWLDTATNATEANQARTDWNADLLDGTFTGLDAIVTSHVAELNDGSGDLKTIYSPQGDGIHPGSLGRWVIAQAVRDALIGQGVVAANIS